GPDQIAHAAILAQDAVHEELGLLTERLTKVVVEVRVEAHVGVDRLQSAQAEPLSRKIARKVVRSRIGEHATGLPLELERPRRAVPRPAGCSTEKTTAVMPARDP